MNPEPLAWVLNLDAEEELDHGRAHTPSAAFVAQLARLVPKLGGLVRPGDTVVFPSGLPRTGLSELVPSPPRDRPHAYTPSRGLCWCPTRWALEQLERAGVPAPRAPPQAVLRRVNHRRFAHELGQALPLAAWADTLEELTSLLAAPRLHEVSTEGQWLLKRPLGYAGKGRRKLRPGPLDAADQAWVEASLRSGDGLLVEPLVQRELDVGLHGWLEEAGGVTWGRPTVQQVDAAGAWVASHVAPEGALTPGEQQALATEGEVTARALHAAGYFGPFGLDAFRWVDARGERNFQPRCELNARFSMGWATGMGDFRPPV